MSAHLRDLPSCMSTHVAGSGASRSSSSDVSGNVNFGAGDLRPPGDSDNVLLVVLLVDLPRQLPRRSE